MIEEDPRFKHIEKKLGVFAAVVILGLALVVFFIGVEKDLFTKKYTLRFTVERGTGFSRGMPVKLSGFHIGRISGIALNENAMVNIDIQIDKKYQKWIHKDSVAKLVKEGLVGDSIVEVSVGSAGSDVLKDGETIAFEKTKGLEEVANDIADKMKPVLIEVRDIINYLNDPNGDIKSSLKNIRTVSAGLEGTRVNADNLLRHAGNEIGRIGTSTVKVLDNAGEKVNLARPPLEKLDSTLSRLPVLLDRVDSALENVEKASLELKSASEKTLPRLSPLVQRAESVMQGADNTINAVQDVWPLKNHRKEVDTTFLPGDSHD